MIVAIKVNGRLIDETQCRPVLLPDGRQGAIWRGLAYPLAADNQIDAGGDAFPPGDCQDGKPALDPARRWTTIEGADAYLIVEGSILDAERAAVRIRENGVRVQRVGRYLGDPVDELAGDWFVKFERPQASNLVEWLAEVLGAEFQTASGATSAPPEELRMSLLLETLAAARRGQDELHERLTAVTRRLADEKGSFSDELVALQANLEAERARREEAEKLAADALAAVQQPRAIPSPARKLKDEIETVLASLLPRIDLQKDTLVFVSSELSDRTSLYRALAELNLGQERMPIRWKKVQGATGWWERHVSSGHDDAGRIYARLDTSTRRWQVLVSHKGDQSRDINWLVRQ